MSKKEGGAGRIRFKGKSGTHTGGGPAQGKPSASPGQGKKITGGGHS